MRSSKALTIIFLIIALVLCPSGQMFGADEGKSLSLENWMILSLEDCVLFSIYNSFDVKLAKLDLYIAETDLLYSEAVFDTTFFGEVTYNEDKSQQLSVFSPDNTQINVYSAGLTKKIPTGTELTAMYSDTRSWNNSQFFTRNPAHNAQLTLEAKQPVGKNFFGYIDRNNITLTKLAIENADLDTQDKIEKHVAEVEKAYWRLVFRKKIVQIRSEILEKAEKLHEANKRNHDIGLIEKAELLASQANLIQRKTDLILAKNNYRKTEENLKLVMNLEDDFRIYPSAEFTGIDLAGSMEASLREAFANRRDYMARQRDIEIKKVNLKIKENQKWPEIDLVASMAMNGIDPKFAKAAGKTTVADNTNLFAGVEFSWPIENSAARSEYKKASHEKEKALFLMKKTERSIITEVVNAYRDVLTFNENLKNFEERVTLQSQKLDEEEKRFRHGRSSTKNLIDFQQDLLAAELSYALAMLDLAISDVDLERAKNALLSKYGEMI